MSIWITPFTLEEINQRGKGTLSEHLQITFIEKGEDFLTASMPVTAQICQPMGILHGGALCALAETVGSAAGNYCIDQREKFCVGLDINANHLRPVHSGIIYAIAKPFHLGSTTQVWEIKMHSGNPHTLVSIARLTTAVRCLGTIRSKHKS